MNICFQIGTSGQILILEKNVLKHFRNHQQFASRSKEAGGQLFGTFSENAVNVKLATGPRISDQRSRFFFSGDRKKDRKEINARYREGLHYLGDWHTHPEKKPSPSKTDLFSMSELFAKSKHELRAFVMIIVGTSDFPTGLHVSMHEEHHWSKIEPTSRLSEISVSIDVV